MNLLNTTVELMRCRTLHSSLRLRFSVEILSSFQFIRYKLQYFYTHIIVFFLPGTLAVMYKINRFSLKEKAAMNIQQL